MNGNSLFRRCFRCRRRRRILKSLISWERGPEKLLMYALEYSSLGPYHASLSPLVEFPSPWAVIGPRPHESRQAEITGPNI